MLEFKLFVHIISIYLLFVFPVALALLQFRPLHSSAPSLIKDVFESLNGISNSHICIWYHQNEFEEVVSVLLTSLTASGKSVSSLQLKEEVLFREECLHNVVLLQNFTICTKIWTTSRPITPLHFVYVVVDAKWELGVEDSSCSGDFGFARVLLVFLRDGRVFSFSPPQFLPRHFLDAQLSDLLLPVKLVLHNLNGREVNIATFNCTPYAVFYEEYNAEMMDGVEGSILKELSALLNFRINIVEKSKDKYGTRQGLSWGEDGIMGALKNYEAEIGLCNIWCDLSNIPVLDFAPINNLVAYTFIVPRPRLLVGSWKNLTGIFQLKVWVAAVCCYCVFSFCYWLRCNIATTKDNIDPIESMLTVFGMLTLTSWTARSAARQLVLWWLVFVLLLTATYSSGIAARLTKPQYELRIDTIQQLVDADFHWYSNNVTDDLKNYVLNMAVQTQKEWANRYRFLPAHMTPASARSRKYAFLTQRLGLSMLVLGIHGLDYDRDLKGMRVLKEKTIDNIFTCFGFPKQSALSYTLQNALLQLRQMGLVDHWTEQAVLRLTPQYMKELQQERDGFIPSVLTPLTMQNLTPAFYILLVGLFLSFILFSLEIFYKRCIRKSCNNKIYPFSPFVKQYEP